MRAVAARRRSCGRGPASSERGHTFRLTSSQTERPPWSCASASPLSGMRGTQRPGPRPGPSFDTRKAAALARLLITPGTRDPAAPGAAGQARAGAFARGTVLERGQSTGTWAERGTGTARPRRRWVILLVAGWLCQAGLRAWFGRMQVMPLANPDETAYLIAARVLAGGPGTPRRAGGSPTPTRPVAGSSGGRPDGPAAQRKRDRGLLLPLSGVWTPTIVGARPRSAACSCTRRPPLPAGADN